MGLVFEGESATSFTLRPPYVPGGPDPKSQVPRTWFTEEDRPRENPIVPTMPRDADTTPQYGPGLLGGSPGYAIHGTSNPVEGLDPH